MSNKVFAFYIDESDDFFAFDDIDKATDYIQERSSMSGCDHIIETIEESLISGSCGADNDEFLYGTMLETDTRPEYMVMLNDDGLIEYAPFASKEDAIRHCEMLGCDRYELEHGNMSSVNGECIERVYLTKVVH